MSINDFIPRQTVVYVSPDGNKTEYGFISSVEGSLPNIRVFVRYIGHNGVECTANLTPIKNLSIVTEIPREVIKMIIGNKVMFDDQQSGVVVEATDSNAIAVMLENSEVRIVSCHLGTPEDRHMGMEFKR